MDAIRKKMKSLKDETDGLYAIINKFEEATKESNRVADQADCDIRDYGKKVHGLEIEFDETTDKLNKALLAYEEKDKSHREVEADIAALTRRIMLMEEEAKKAETTLANTVTKLAMSSKEADDVLKKVKVVESKCMNNEVTLEELDKNLRQTTKMASDNEQKLDELTRKLGVQEEELRRTLERAELAENKLKGIEEELQMVGENMKQLEQSAEKVTPPVIFAESSTRGLGFTISYAQLKELKALFQRSFVVSWLGYFIIIYGIRELALATYYESQTWSWSSAGLERALTLLFCR